MEVRHEVHDGHLLARRVGLGRLYLYLFEVRDLLQLEGVRRGAERDDAAQHLVSGRALCRFTPYRCNLAPRLAAVSLSERALCKSTLTDAIWRSFGCSALVASTAYAVTSRSPQRAETGTNAIGADSLSSHFAALRYSWSLPEVVVQQHTGAFTPPKQEVKDLRASGETLES